MKISCQFHLVNPSCKCGDNRVYNITNDCVNCTRRHAAKKARQTMKGKWHDFYREINIRRIANEEEIMSGVNYE